MRVAVLASGSGTILEAILDEGVPVALVVVDRPCRATEVAERHGVPAELVLRDRYDGGFDRATFTDEVLGLLRAHDIELVVMAGYGTILGPAVFEAFDGRVLNTHPALLPAFKGWHAVRDALEAGVAVTGCTVHVATAAVDDGPILAQAEVAVQADDTESSLHERIKEVERPLYVQTIKDILERGAVR